MPDNELDAQAVPSPASDAGAGSSPADVAASPEVSEQATPQTADQGQAGQDVPFHQHPRWIERQREIERLRQEKEALLGILQRQQPTQQVVQPQPDPLDSLVNNPDPQVAQFWRQNAKMVELIAEKKAQERVAQLEQPINMARQQLAQVTISNFRRENPDIKAGSPEESAIAEYVQQGYPLEHAKRIVLFDRYESLAKQQTQRQQTTVTKRQTPPDSSAGMPANNGIPQKKRGSIRDTFLQLAKESGL